MPYTNDVSRRRAWYSCDWANSVFSTSVVAVFFGPYLTDVARAAADGDGRVHPLGVPVQPEAVFPAATGLSMVLLAIVLPVTGATAARVPRSRLLGGLTLLGSGATLGLGTVSGDEYLRGAGLYVVAAVALAASIVVVDTYLPEIAEGRERGRVSSMASAAGFTSGVLVLALSLLLVEGPWELSEPVAVRGCLVLAGAWWLLFMLRPVLVLPDTPTPRHDAYPSAGLGFASLRRTTVLLWRTPLVPAFLVAFLLYNNATQGVSSLAGAFGAEALQVSQGDLTVGVLLTNAAGALGAYLAGRAATRFGSEAVLAVSLTLLAVALVVSTGAPAGSPGAFYAIAVVVGASIGCLYPLSRAVLADLAPRGQVGASYAVFELVNRSLSSVGLLVCTAALQVGVPYRFALLPLVPFVVAGVVVLMVRVRRVAPADLQPDPAGEPSGGAS